MTVATVSFIAQLAVQLAGIFVSTPLVQDRWFWTRFLELHSCVRATGPNM